MANATCIEPVSYAHRGAAMLLIGADSPAAAAAIAVAGGRLVRRIDWPAVASDLSAIVAAPVVLVEARGVDTATLDAALPLVARFLDTMDARCVVTLAAAQIDVVTGHLSVSQADLLCDPTAEDRTAALMRATRPRLPALRDSLPDGVQDDRDPYRHGGTETDDQRLRRLTDGMAHISRYAADLIRPEPPGSAGPEVADRRRAFGSGPGLPDTAIAAAEVRRLIQLRRLRGKFFGQFIGEGLFEDPAWDMLLDLFAAELEGTRVSVSSLCIAAGVAPTTALRWIARMTEMGLFIRHPDPVDRRRAFMALSPRAADAMRAYVLAARKVEAG